MLIFNRVSIVWNQYA